VFDNRKTPKADPAFAQESRSGLGRATLTDYAGTSNMIGEQGISWAKCIPGDVTRGGLTHKTTSRRATNRNYLLTGRLNFERDRESAHCRATDFQGRQASRSAGGTRRRRPAVSSLIRRTVMGMRAPRLETRHADWSGKGPAVARGQLSGKHFLFRRDVAFTKRVER